MPTQQQDSTSYLLRRVDRQLWRQVKARAAIEGKTIQKVVIELLTAYAVNDADV